MKIKLTRRGEIVRDILIGLTIAFVLLLICSYDSIADAIITGS